jgi:uncharacterized membrane protein YeaQ/YmgE (transglycosylase-associated protein family)
MLILGILLFGMLAGAAAQLLLGSRVHGINWTTALVAGLLGSFIGGLLVSLLAGDGVGPDSDDAEIRAVAAKHPAFEVLPVD